ncbi:HAD family hydrolase [Sphingomonas montanisoli]|uniref:HAD family hydrolase n=2 Tax=Sphingomonas montanisoli TaxID=2606412 RepID=A0A5D9C4N7_9SPHN|nr:HAD family hydrolase [Sphingomonas montanisoli]
MGMSGRPLLITDCDEVLLHMVGPFQTWLDRDHAIDFDLEGENFEGALVRRHDASVVQPGEIWPLLDAFFTNQMHSQTLVPHADRALATIAEVADIVVLTNITEQFHAGRVDQLAALDIRHRVQCNQGGKGEPIARLVEEFQPSVTVFVDDTPFHHGSVAKYAPEVWRLHMIAEPRVAVRRPPAPDAHARIDDWSDALPWILGRFGEGVKAAA